MKARSEETPVGMCSVNGGKLLPASEHDGNSEFALRGVRKCKVLVLVVRGKDSAKAGMDERGQDVSSVDTGSIE